MTTDAEATWSIAELADEFGITHRAVRYYESLGLLAPERDGTRRIFHRRDHTRLALVLRGRRLGFPLEEIRTIVDMYDDVPGKQGQLRYVLGQVETRRADLQSRLKDVQDALAELDDFERRCHEALGDAAPATPGKQPA